MSATMSEMSEDPLWPPRHFVLNIMWYFFIVPVIAFREVSLGVCRRLTTKPE